MVFTTALVGPDGSGKSLVSQRLADAAPDLPMKRVYMGINLEASTVMLPTTWLLLVLKRAAGGRPDMAGPAPSQQKKSAKSPLKRLLSEAKAWILLVNRVAEEWFRQVVVWIYLRQGKIVLFDRHFGIDYYFYDMAYQDAEKPLHRRVHGFLLKRFYPQPDLVIYLDAPEEVLFERKGEGTLETLRRRREEYLSLRAVMPAFEVIDASQPVDQVVAQTAEAIRRFAASRVKAKNQRRVDSPSGQVR